MRKWMVTGLVGMLLVSACAVLPGREKSGETVQLFNGENLDGWRAHLVDPAVAMEDVWSVKDGILVCRGEPFGYLYSEAEFTDFRLVVEWRWPEGLEPGNSGVLMRMSGEPPSFLTRCVEAQLKHDAAGDIWAFYGFKVAGDADRFVDVEHGVFERLTGVRRIQGAEKPVGEWNRYEITLQGEHLELVINGELVNQAHGVTLESGPVGLQSEGGEIHFRTIELTPL